MNCETVNILIAAGTWFTGLATLSAVIVSLSLARKASRVMLRGNAGHHIMIPLPVGQISDLIEISVTNVGFRPVSITSVGWVTGLLAYGPWRKHWAIQNCDRSLASHNLPSLLQDGETLTCRFPVDFDDPDNWYQRMAVDFAYGTIRRLTLRCVVDTSLGQRLLIKPSRDLLRHLEEAARHPKITRAERFRNEAATK